MPQQSLIKPVCRIYLYEWFKEGEVGEIKGWLRSAPEEHGDPLEVMACALDAFEPVVIAAKKAGVKRFVFASSSSVYGISDEPDVKETDDFALFPDLYVYTTGRSS